jgi:hypothetical protein
MKKNILSHPVVFARVSKETNLKGFHMAPRHSAWQHFRAHHGDTQYSDKMYHLVALVTLGVITLILSISK